ncbi:MAG: hypothetical protein ACFFD4_24390 [Candidatus Odinarchaeota archaeon]
MTTITIEQDLARDLIETRLKILNAEIEMVVKARGQPSALKMIDSAMKGELPGAKSDVIILKRMLDKKKELEQLLSKIGKPAEIVEETAVFKQALTKVIEEDRNLLEKLAR